MNKNFLGPIVINNRNMVLGIRDNTREGELSRFGWSGNPVKRENFFSYRHFSSPARDETVQIAFGALVY